MALPHRPPPFHHSTEELGARVARVLADTAEAVEECRRARDECHATVARCRQMNPDSHPGGPAG
jgi:hypothetical protein